MLAKVWKKALLAVCIIACLYNVMSKLVSRTSLEVQLRSVQDQTSLTEGLKNKDSMQNQGNQNESETLKNQINSNKINQQNRNQEETIVVIN